MRAVAKTALKNRRDLHARRLSSAENFVRAREGDFDGLLDDEVFARPDRGERRFEMRPTWRRDAHDVDVGPREECSQVSRLKRHVIFRREGVDFSGASRSDAKEFRAFQRRDGLCVKVGDHA